MVDELRLMIDSMDSVGGTLDNALAGFRTRLQPRIEDAGFRFVWINELGDNIPPYPPRKSLQLFRIMQEAVTNALKHSGGTTITILLRSVSEDREWLEVVVSDDGGGMKGVRLGGHGLENMRARAKKEGGSIAYETNPDGGTDVVIKLPTELDDDDTGPLSGNPLACEDLP